MQQIITAVCVTILSTSRHSYQMLYFSGNIKTKAQVSFSVLKISNVLWMIISLFLDLRFFLHYWLNFDVIGLKMPDLSRCIKQRKKMWLLRILNKKLISHHWDNHVTLRLSLSLLVRLNKDKNRFPRMKNKTFEIRIRNWILK
jgi:hypothetical protein